MSSRRIPISSSQRQPAPAPSNTAFRSSLDLVFSYTRSAAFFGENLPSGPSFVDSDRYRRPGFPQDEENSFTGAEGEGDDSTVGRGESDWGRTTDADTEGITTSEGEGDGEGWSGDDLAGGDDTLLVGGRWDREQLPRNAVVRPPPPPIPRQMHVRHESSADSIGVPSPQAVRSFFRDRSPPPHPPPGSSPTSAPFRSGWTGSPSTERTPLLTPSYSPPDSVPFPRRTAEVTAALASHAKRTSPVNAAEEGRTTQRRPSTFSREAWKAAIEEHRGESTYGQTLFNCVNVLVGVGLLADPLAFADAGWVLGTLLLLFCALVTNYTAKMLASLMRLDPSTHTYADVLIRAFGPRTRRWIYALFVLELGTFSVAAIELFADSMSSLFPTLSSTAFKIMSYAILLPTTFLPLRLLSLTSLLGILAFIVLLAVVIADGSIKRTAPGSLWDTMDTSVGPRWGRLPISFGLFMSGFSGHAVVPSLYRDMKNPRHFNSMINLAYVIAFSVSLVFGVLGYLMFGNDVSSEITRDLAATKGYPVALTKLAVWMVAINPLVKYAIANKPLVHTFEHLIGLHPAPTLPSSPPPPGSSSSDSALTTTSSFSHPSPAPPPTPDPQRTQRIRYFVLRPLLSLAFVACAIAIPEFDRVLAFLGSASAFVICCVGPIGAYLVLGRRKGPGEGKVGRGGEDERERRRMQDELLEGWERAVCWLLLGTSIAMAVVGTVWSFLPLE
ncbi:hypothetical protein JCM5296_004148 [Sporobolomyces johnsonii]